MIIMKISKTTIVLAGIAAFTILAMWTIASEKRTPRATPAAAGFETREQSDGNVTVIVTPEALAAGKLATFQMVFDTHSVDLNFDVAAAAELRDEKGNTYSPPTWKGDPPGGHHRKGTLTFPKPMTQASNVTLTLKDIAEVKERTFIWKL